ncbi:lipid storage droplets surface-binding protein 2-like [Hylaeus anthracinus]|uniref:lipid storage droplets surface-binding protein 2-like n=1 Tax=Hylaeus anthracinus TaxID=313031 RepID=UPI0023B9811D|nr:lipid storage droplets surface-binding protein 2-like [Hylaeus anthracinus]
MATGAAQLPHIEVFHRVLTLPVVESAMTKSVATYSRVKDSHYLVHWVLSTAETSLKQAVPIAVPIAKKLENPIHFVDHTLCLGLDKIEEKVPMVKEKPEQILENAYTLALQTVQPAVSSISHANDLIVSQASNLKDMSWNKANQILETSYGSAAVKSLDSTAVVVDKLIDKYFPATGDEESLEIKTDEEDKLLHTLQTVGRLSNKAACRVYSNLLLHLRIINKDNFKSYISSLLQFLQLTQYLHAINEKVQAQTSNTNDTPTKPTKN